MPSRLRLAFWSAASQRSRKAFSLMAPRAYAVASSWRTLPSRRLRNQALLMPTIFCTNMGLVFSGGPRHGAPGRPRPKPVDVGRTYDAEAEAGIGWGVSSSSSSCGREGDQQVLETTPRT
jgi:hypothetical protein